MWFKHATSSHIHCRHRGQELPEPDGFPFARACSRPPEVLCDRQQCRHIPDFCLDRLQQRPQCLQLQRARADADWPGCGIHSQLQLSLAGTAEDPYGLASALTGKALINCLHAIDYRTNPPQNSLFQDPLRLATRALLISLSTDTGPYLKLALGGFH